MALNFCSRPLRVSRCGQRKSQAPFPALESQTHCPITCLRLLPLSLCSSHSGPEQPDTLLPQALCTCRCSLCNALLATPARLASSFKPSNATISVRLPLVENCSPSPSSAPVAFPHLLLYFLHSAHQLGARCLVYLFAGWMSLTPYQ